MNGYYPVVVRELRQAGFYQVSGGKGSHEKWTDGRRMVTVPFNCKSRHTANAILKDAGLRVKV